jgi:hypothetical protein
MEVKTEKLYVCQADDTSLSLQTRIDVDSWIKNAEEANGSLSYTVVGSILSGSDKPYFLLTYKNGSIIGYDVVNADNEEDAKTLFLAKKRNAGKKIEFKRIQDLSNLIKQYYE